MSGTLRRRDAHNLARLDGAKRSQKIKYKVEIKGGSQDQVTKIGRNIEGETRIEDQGFKQSTQA